MAKTALDAFNVGDRVELLLFYRFREDDPLPKGEVVSVSNRYIRVRMDRHKKVRRFTPSDLRVILRRPR